MVFKRTCSGKLSYHLRNNCNVGPQRIKVEGTRVNPVVTDDASRRDTSQEGKSQGALDMGSQIAAHDHAGNQPFHFLYDQLATQYKFVNSLVKKKLHTDANTFTRLDSKSQVV